MQISTKSITIKPNIKQNATQRCSHILRTKTVSIWKPSWTRTARTRSALARSVVARALLSFSLSLLLSLSVYTYISCWKSTDGESGRRMWRQNSKKKSFYYLEQVWQSIHGHTDQAYPQEHFPLRTDVLINPRGRILYIFSPCQSMQPLPWSEHAQINVQ